MFDFFAPFSNFAQVIKQELQNPEFRALLSLVALTLAVGTVFYHFVERWSWLNSLYFSVITLTTVGYGDFSPQTSLGKVFTIFYIFIGLGILAGFVGVVGNKMLVEHTARRERRYNKDNQDK